MSGRYALLIATYQYEDEGLRRLVAPAQDADSLARVLSDPEIGGFQTKVLLNKVSGIIREEIEAFFTKRKRDDLLLLYFSGHGLRDDYGRLYFATSETKRSRLRSTSLSANYINDLMRDSRSRQQVLLLDCCYSGAFAKGMLAKADKSVGTKEHFEGKGRVVLTASDSLQYAFEGDGVEGESECSIFTQAIVSGLETGQADLDQDGEITLDELYDYVHDRVIEETPKQRPGKWEFDVQGEIVIASNPNPVVKPVELPRELQQSIKSPLTWVRLGAVHELELLLKSGDKGLEQSALFALEGMKEDDSRRVRMLVSRILDEYTAGVRTSEAEIEKGTTLKELFKLMPPWFWIIIVFVVLIIFFNWFFIPYANNIALARATATPTMTSTQIIVSSASMESILTKTKTPSPTPTNTPTSTPTATLTPTFTPTPTPNPKDAIFNLINTEREAVLTRNIDLIQSIFAVDATKTDALTGQTRNAIEDYTEDFETEEHLEIMHANFQFDLEDDFATVTNDSCGTLIDRKKALEGQTIAYSCVQCDKWTFERDNKGRWWITNFTYGLSPSSPSQNYTFEYENNGCWDVRYVEGEAQGKIPTHTTEKAYKGNGSIQFEFDLGSLSTYRAQTIHYNMPFTGQASAWVYAPPDAPADLEAGFFAMEFNYDPWNLHPADQRSLLDPGQWTQIIWDVDTSSWVSPLHLLGIEVRRDNGGAWEGYVLIDDVTIQSQ